MSSRHFRRLLKQSFGPGRASFAPALRCAPCAESLIRLGRAPRSDAKSIPSSSEALLQRAPDARTRRGFTLLECEVALIVLVLLIAGLGNLTAAHQRLLGAVDEWMAGDPTFFVARPGEYVYVRVVQADSQLAWSSPFFVR